MAEATSAAIAPTMASALLLFEQCFEPSENFRKMTERI
jgi:hypothetical protein